MPYTLLLADDSVTIRRVIELTFADESVRVLSVSSGREALDRLEGADDKPDIVLADIGMADVSGYDISKFIKGRADLRHIPVLLLAGAFEPLDEARARASGSNGVLVKPFEPQMVVARVHELLSRQTSAQAPAGAYSIAPPPARGREDAGPPAPVSAPSRSLDDLEPTRAASARSATTDPLFDESLDRLDAGFGDTRAAGLDADAVSDFAQDLKELRSAQPAAAFKSDEFGDWDLPSRAAPPAGAAGPASDLAWEEPVRAPAAAPGPPLVTLPPPIALEPLPAPQPAPRLAAAPPPVPAFARPAAPSLADAFGSLLAAEEGRPHAPVPLAAFVHMPVDAVQTASGASALPASGELSDEVIDKIVDKVVARLGAGVRGTVLDLAERLVRAEIDRLKALR